MAEFRERLQQAMDRAQVTAAELSRQTGIGEGAISQYRKGAYKATQANLEKIAAALNVSIPWLMGVDTMTTAPTVRVSPERQELLDMVDSLTDEEVTRLLQIARLVTGG